MDAGHLLPHSHDDKFLDVPYEDRWEYLKPVIVQLYMGKYGPNGKSMTTGQVAVFMRDHYSFTAAETQYRHHFNKWGVRRRIHGAEKEDIVAALGRRARPETSTSDVTLEPDKAVDKKQLKRYLKDQIRHYNAEPMSPGVLSSWNLPYAAYAKALGKKAGQPSPFGGIAATPTYLSVQSPDAATPGREAAGPSPAMQLVRQKVAKDRANLFLQGRHLELLASCGKEDRVTLTNYLHDFYMHSFVVAKYWGRGPRADQWTAGLVSALTLGSFGVASSASPPSAMSPASAPDKQDRLIDPPTQLCRWSLHVASVLYTPVPEVSMDAQDGFDIQDPRSWRDWPAAEQAHPTMSFTESMHKSLTDSTFSLTLLGDVPISTELISQSVQRDPELLRVDAWKVAIMAGNVELLGDLFECDGECTLPERINDIHPLHLAASFLDGGNTCCNMMMALSGFLGTEYLFFHERDHLGHTVLDTLMITILRSHTTVHPEQVSARFDPPHRFPGEEKDICGRWDADSPAVRALFRHGYARIPTSWKHAFCHTATQAVCHGVIAMLGSPASPRIDSLSGLFVRRCNNCGLELKLGPLHTLVVVAFYLAHRGLPGETLFGALAVLVCLLSLGADASLKTVMSVQDILGHAEPGRCCHKLMDAYDLMQEVPHDFVSQWSTGCQTGWMCILQVLLQAKLDPDGNPRRQTRGSKSDFEGDESGHDSDAGSDEDHCYLETQGMSAHDEWLRLPCRNPKLGLLWATIQVELLTYRRIHATDPWVSDRFSMAALKTWLEGGSSEFRTPLVEQEMMRYHSPCGWFPCDDFLCPVAEEVCNGYFMNMDVYDRATFLQRPAFTESWLEVVPPEEP